MDYIYFKLPLSFWLSTNVHNINEFNCSIKATESSVLWYWHNSLANWYYNDMNNYGIILCI